MPSAFLQWLYADAADGPQTGYEVSRNSDPMSPKFTRPRNSASGSTYWDYLERQAREARERAWANSFDATVHIPCLQVAALAGMLGRDDPFRAAAIRSRP